MPELDGWPPPVCPVGRWRGPTATLSPNLLRQWGNLSHRYRGAWLPCQAGWYKPPSTDPISWPPLTIALLVKPTSYAAGTHHQCANFVHLHLTQYIPLLRKEGCLQVGYNGEVKILKICLQRIPHCLGYLCGNPILTKVPPWCGICTLLLK